MATNHCNKNHHLKKAKSMILSNLIKYMPEPTGEQLNAINDCLEETLSKDIYISYAEANRRRLLCEQMNVIAKENGAKLSICGSLVTELALTDSSDVNIYLDIDSRNDKKSCNLSFLSLLSTKFQQCLTLKSFVKIEKVNYGLICEDCKGVIYHISTSSFIYQLSSTLLSVYLRVDDRAKQLCKLFRYFANQAFIDNDRNGLFPPQVFSILVVFYLQHLPIPILPNLHKLAELHDHLPDTLVTSVIIKENIIRYVSDLSAIKSLWTPPRNTSTLSELWVGLLRFYAFEFDKIKYMVSIICEEYLLKVDRNIVNKRLAVDDPFEYKKNLLFHWNTPDVINFVDDQIQRCYIYFGVPQLKSGSAFTRVNNLGNAILSLNPELNNGNVTVAINSMEDEFLKLYNVRFNNIRRYSVGMFVYFCLETILTSIFKLKSEISYLVFMYEYKLHEPYMSFENYEIFKEHVVNLVKVIFNDFAEYLNKNESRNSNEITNKRAMEMIKESVDKFIKKSLSLSNNEIDFDDDDEDDIINGKIKISNETQDQKMGCSRKDAQDPKRLDNFASSKNPISFNEVLVSDEENVNNEGVQALQCNEMKYIFNKCVYHKRRLKLVCTICNKEDHRPEYCEDAMPTFKEFKNILQEVSADWLSKLNVILFEKYESTLPSKNRLELCEEVFQDVSKIIYSIYPDAEPQLFGSFNNGFLTYASDMDICLEFFVDQKIQPLTNKDITTRLLNIGRTLTDSLKGVDIAYILRHKLPIIKFFLKNKIQGDISINNTLAIYNTRMLKLYSTLFPQLKYLGNLLKIMSKLCNGDSASKGILSSYSYILLLIHFLQKRGFLPVLQELYEGKNKPKIIIDDCNVWYQSDTDVINKLWMPNSNIASLGYLWLDFFYYYLVEFNFNREVVTIKQSAQLFKIDKWWQMSYMAIEDPFDLNHDLNESLPLNKSRCVLKQFAHMFKLHSNQDNLKADSLSLLMEPALVKLTEPEIRSCFKCKKEGHIARHCRNEANNFNVSGINRELPFLSIPFTCKESTEKKHFYVELDEPTHVSTISIPIEKFNLGTNNIAVLPIKLPFGDKSIVIPMMIEKNGLISSKLNNLLQSGLYHVTPLFKEMSTNRGVCKPQTSFTTKDISLEIAVTPRNRKSRRNMRQRKRNDNFDPNSMRIMMTNTNTNAMRNIDKSDYNDPNAGLVESHFSKYQDQRNNYPIINFIEPERTPSIYYNRRRVGRGNKR